MMSGVKRRTSVMPCMHAMHPSIHPLSQTSIHTVILHLPFDRNKQIIEEKKQTKKRETGQIKRRETLHINMISSNPKHVSSTR